MTCSICYENQQDCDLVCGHSFCNECIIQWCPRSTTCPYCRHTLKIKSSVQDVHTRELKIDHDVEYNINKIYQDIINFHNKGQLCKKYNTSFDDVKYLMSKPWSKYVMVCEDENPEKDIKFTKYSFINNPNLKQITLKRI